MDRLAISPLSFQSLFLAKEFSLFFDDRCDLTFFDPWIEQICLVNLAGQRR